MATNIFTEARRILNEAASLEKLEKMADDKLAKIKFVDFPSEDAIVNHFKVYKERLRILTARDAAQKRDMPGIRKKEAAAGKKHFKELGLKAGDFTTFGIFVSADKEGATFDTGSGGSKIPFGSKSFGSSDLNYAKLKKISKAAWKKIVDARGAGAIDYQQRYSTRQFSGD